MKTISPRDASLLALLAEEPASTSGLRKRVLKELKSEAFNIAVEIGKNSLLPGSATNSQARAAATARGLEGWAKTNKRSSNKISRTRHKA